MNIINSNLSISTYPGLHYPLRWVAKTRYLFRIQGGFNFPSPLCLVSYEEETYRGASSPLDHPYWSPLTSNNDINYKNFNPVIIVVVLVVMVVGSMYQ